MKGSLTQNLGNVPPGIEGLGHGDVLEAVVVEHAGPEVANDSSAQDEDPGVWLGSPKLSHPLPAVVDAC